MSAAPLIGTSPAFFRSLTSCRRPIPEKYLPAIESLPARPPGKRWSPAEIAHPVEDHLPAAVETAGEAETVAKRKSRVQRRREQPLPEISPAAYDERHPVVEAEADAEPSGFLGRLVEVLSPLAALIKSGSQVLEDKPLDGEILPPVPAQLPAAIPRRDRGDTAGSRAIVRLPPGVVLPYPEFFGEAVLPGYLRGIICEAPVTVRLEGGTLSAGHCGRLCDPGSSLCMGHRKIEQTRAVNAARPNVATLSLVLPAAAPARMKTKPRPPPYW